MKKFAVLLIGTIILIAAAALASDTEWYKAPLRGGYMIQVVTVDSFTRTHLKIHGVKRAVQRKTINEVYTPNYTEAVKIIVDRIVKEIPQFDASKAEALRVYKQLTGHDYTGNK